MDQATIERSRTIQRQLAAIEANRDGFIDALIAGWTPYLDGRAYEPASELRSIAKETTAWRLYGASLVGDYRVMIDVLSGKASAGKFINAWASPQPRHFATPSNDLGQTTSQLVFTPIPPCRMVDTRNPGARTGILTPGVARAFDLTTDGYAKGQGGATSGCAGLPSLSAQAWAVNITATGYANNGGLTAYPYLGTPPLASAINYAPSIYAIANNGHVTGCYGCIEDVNVVAFGAAAHVIIDVVGHYEQATGFAAGTPVITRLAGPTTGVAAGASVLVSGANCPAGTVVIGGSQTNTGSGGILTSDHHVSGAAWYEYVTNTGGLLANVTIYSTCLEIN